MKPRAEVGPCFETSELAIGPDETLLDDVLGVLLVAGDAVGQLKSAAAVAFDEGAEGFAVPLPGTGQHCSHFGRVHSARLDGNRLKTVRFQGFEGVQRFWPR